MDDRPRGGARGRPAVLLLLALLLGSGSGCVFAGGEKLLVFTTYTRTGIHVGAVNGQPVSALFGYKRFEGAILPVRPEESVDVKEMVDGTAVDVPSDMPSVYASLDLENKWFGGLRVDQCFATGAAAVRMARTGARNRLVESEEDGQ